MSEDSFCSSAIAEYSSTSANVDAEEINANVDALPKIHTTIDRLVSHKDNSSKNCNVFICKLQNINTCTIF